MNRSFSNAFLSLIAAFLLLISSTSVHAQQLGRIERQRFKSMLDTIKKEIKDDYYDQEFKGINLDERFGRAERRIDEVKTPSEAIGVIAQVLLDFDDSHLYFIPPTTTLSVEYGWRMQMFGDKCFVTTVKPKSDAEAKGLKVGDEIVAIDRFAPNRDDFWKINYFFNIVNKRPGIRINALSPGAQEPRQIDIAAEVLQRPKTVTLQMMIFDSFRWDGQSPNEFNLFKHVGNTTIWKMPTFSIDPDLISTLVGRIRGQNLVLDLRGNGGGFVVTLEKLAGHMFDRDLQIAELKGRKQMKPQKSKTIGKDAFAGKLVVLVDHQSGSAAEIFARLVQLEKRGIVVGDVSAGAVMQSRPFYTGSGANDEVMYGASITNADVIMSDGKSLEHVGVQPDYVVLPTGADLAARRDPVLSRAVELAGATLSPEDAGKFFTWKWRSTPTGEIYLQLLLDK